MGKKDKKNNDDDQEPEIAGKRVVRIQNWACPICETTYGSEGARNACWNKHGEDAANS